MYQNKIKILSSLIMTIGLLVQATSFASLLVLDMLSTGAHTYSLEITQVGDTYSVQVKEATSRGKFDLLYESQEVLKTSGKFDEYSDDRFKLTDRKDGTATLELDNGKKIVAELNSIQK